MTKIKDMKLADPSRQADLSDSTDCRADRRKYNPKKECRSPAGHLQRQDSVAEWTFGGRVADSLESETDCGIGRGDDCRRYSDSSKPESSR